MPENKANSNYILKYSNVNEVKSNKLGCADMIVFK